MVGEVEADGDELADPRHRSAETRVALDDGKRAGVDRRQLLQLGGRQLVAVDVVDLAGKVADLALGIQNSGTFLARRAVA